MMISLEAILGDFSPLMPDWAAVETWICGHVEGPKQQQAWTQAATDWLDRLDQHFGGAYDLLEGDGLLLWHPRSGISATALFDYVQWARSRAVELFGPIAGARGPKPLVVLVFASEDAYYEYLSQFYPEGEWGASGGFCVGKGFTHIVLPPGWMDSLQLAASHELSHALLSELPLPQWVEEGMARTLEESLHALGRSPSNPETVHRVRAYWREHGLDAFWWGEGFWKSGEAQEASYVLAKALVRLMLADHRRQIADFLCRADYGDAGETAARESLGTSLSELAARFLGPGDWSPIPKDAAGYTYRACLWAKNRRYAEARADYEAALAMDPQDAAANNDFAWLLATCPDDRLRDGARAILLAERACTMSGEPPWHHLDTLAAAYAEAGRFDEACDWATRALEAAPEEQRPGCVELLELYRQRKPYRETESV